MVPDTLRQNVYVYCVSQCVSPRVNSVEELAEIEWIGIYDRLRPAASRQLQSTL
jgi:hypothetical protein